MTRDEKLMARILRGTSDRSIGFDDLVRLLRRLGFEMRVRGSHHLFHRRGVEEKINLQRDGKHAKAYQIRQVRAVIVKYHLAGDEDDAA